MSVRMCARIKYGGQLEWQQILCLRCGHVHVLDVKLHEIVFVCAKFGERRHVYDTRTFEPGVVEEYHKKRGRPGEKTDLGFLSVGSGKERKLEFFSANYTPFFLLGFFSN